MSAFDDLTLGEIELLQKEALGGKTISSIESDPLMVAGAIMWITERKTDPTVSWDDFKSRTTVRAMKDFSLQIEADELNPTMPPNVTVS